MSDKIKYFSEQNMFMHSLNPKESLYMDTIKGGQLERPEYVSNIRHIRLPFPKFHDVNVFLESYYRNSNTAMKSLCLAGLSNELRNNEREMLAIIRHVPEAIWHVGDKLTNDSFLEKALHRNPMVYDVLSEDLQKSKFVIDAYAEGMWKSGSIYADRVNGEWDMERLSKEPDESLPIYEYAVNKNCDKSTFYSIENYRKAHEIMLLNEPSVEECRGNPKNFNDFSRYDRTIAYLQMANIENEHLRAQYQLVEAENIAKHIDKLRSIVRKNPASQMSKHLAEAVAYSANILTDPQATLGLQNTPNPELAASLIDKIQKAEHMYYVDKGDMLRERLNEYNGTQGVNRETRAQFIDYFMEMAENHPEMGISKDKITAWWEQRGEDYRRAMEQPMEYPLQQSNRNAHYERFAQKHPEMRIGEQLEIAGFNKDTSAQEIEELGKMMQ